jgi:hypothetical protein
MSESLIYFLIFIIFCLIIFIIKIEYEKDSDTESEDDEDTVINPVTIPEAPTSKNGVPSNEADPISTSTDVTVSKGPEIVTTKEGFFAEEEYDKLDLSDPSLYAEKIKHDSLHGTNIEKTHREFAMSVKPNLLQPASRTFIIRDDYQNPNLMVGFPRTNAFVRINRDLPGNSVPSDDLSSMKFGTVLKIETPQEGLTSALKKSDSY